MPHIIVKLWPGKTEPQKAELAEALAQTLTKVLQYKDASISVAITEIPADEWAERVYRPDILDGGGSLYKKPGYGLKDLPD